MCGSRPKSLFDLVIGSVTSSHMKNETFWRVRYFHIDPSMGH